METLPLQLMNWNYDCYTPSFGKCQDCVTGKDFSTDVETESSKKKPGERDFLFLPAVI
jgi:hypothetical protein